MNGFPDVPQARKSPLTSTSLQVRFFPFEGGGVLFLPGTRRIWALNAASACIWCLMDELDDPEELAAAMADRFSIDEATARRDVHAVLTIFAQEGLLEGGSPSDFPEEPDLDPLDSCGPRLMTPASWKVRSFYRTPGRTFEFCSDDAVTGAQFAEIMAPLALDPPGAVDTHLAVLQNRGVGCGLDIYLDGRRRLAGVPQDELLPHLFALFCRHACESMGENLLLHAAVLGSEGRMVLFPAEAGGGKTTLAAVLAAQGFTFFSDELALLEFDQLRVRPLPLPMTIKAGSTPILERLYPGLSRRPVYQRSDGKAVRYLVPPAASLPDNSSPEAMVRAVVFPRYESGAENHLGSLTKVEALQRLALTGSSIRDYHAGDIRTMIAVVERNPCFELVYGDPLEAVYLLRKHVFNQ